MIASSFIITATAVLAATAAVAAPINKCVVGGKVTYQQDPCPSGKLREPPSIADLNAAEKRRRAAAASASSGTATPSSANVTATFSCDGRKHCSQMKSCAEAKYFLANCLGVEMDGDHDGVPCEQQWCDR